MGNSTNPLSLRLNTSSFWKSELYGYHYYSVVQISSKIFNVTKALALSKNISVVSLKTFFSGGVYLIALTYRKNYWKLRCRYKTRKRGCAYIYDKIKKLCRKKSCVFYKKITDYQLFLHRKQQRIKKRWLLSKKRKRGKLRKLRKRKRKKFSTLYLKKRWRLEYRPPRRSAIFRARKRVLLKFKRLMYQQSTYNKFNFLKFNDSPISEYQHALLPLNTSKLSDAYKNTDCVDFSKLLIPKLLNNDFIHILGHTSDDLLSIYKAAEIKLFVVFKRLSTLTKTVKKSIISELYSLSKTSYGRKNYFFLYNKLLIRSKYKTVKTIAAVKVYKQRNLNFKGYNSGLIRNVHKSQKNNFLKVSKMQKREQQKTSFSKAQNSGLLKFTKPLIVRDVLVKLNSVVNPNTMVNNCFNSTLHKNVSLTQLSTINRLINFVVHLENLKANMHSEYMRIVLSVGLTLSSRVRALKTPYTGLSKSLNMLGVFKHILAFIKSKVSVTLVNCINRITSKRKLIKVLLNNSTRFIRGVNVWYRKKWTFGKHKNSKYGAWFANKRKVHVFKQKKVYPRRF